MPAFEGVGRETVMADAAEFYAALEADGFIVTGETEEELAVKDRGFTYGAVRVFAGRKSAGNVHNFL